MASNAFSQLPVPYVSLVWDYDISEEEFLEKLEQEDFSGWLDTAWAAARVLDNVPYHQAIQILPLQKLQRIWPHVRGKVRYDEIREGYDFALRRYAVSAAK